MKWQVKILMPQRKKPPTLVAAKEKRPKPTEVTEL